MKFAVTYTETLARTVIIEAEDWVQAEDIMSYLVDEEHIVLDFDDFTECEYSVDEASDYNASFFDDVDEMYEDAMRRYRSELEEN